MNQLGTFVHGENIEGPSDHSGMPMLDDLTNPEESPFLKGGTGQQRKLRGKEITMIDSAQSLAELADRIDLLRAEDIEEISLTRKIRIISISLPYAVSLFVSTAVSTICGVSIYLGVTTGKTLIDPYASLFWLFGSIGIVLMSLKGISSWRRK